MSPDTVARADGSVAMRPAIPLTACMVVIAAFSKSFVPFQFLGSSAIFGFALLLAVLGLLLDWPVYWRRIRALKPQILWVAALFGFSATSFLLQSRDSVPATYLLGMTGLLSLFLLLGIIASFALRSVLIFLFSTGLVYLIYCVIYLLENGTLYPGGYFGDIFGLGRNWGGVSSYDQFYQNVGLYLAVGTLALIGLTRNWDGVVRFWSVIVFGSACFALILAAQARGALVGLLIALTVSFKFRRKRLLIVLLVAAGITVASTTGYFVDSVEQLPIWQRTEHEVLAPKPRTRLAIVNSLASNVYHNPRLLLFGRGLGMFPVDIGDAPPDWLLSSQPLSLYPHNPVIEALYELGVIGVVLVIGMMIAPIVMARRLHGGIERCRPALSLYLFAIIIEMVSGSLAYSYSFYFFYGLLTGTVASLKDEDHERDLLLSRSRGTAAR
jgi:hypothetical protein